MVAKMVVVKDGWLSKVAVKDELDSSTSKDGMRRLLATVALATLDAELQQSHG
ncbi:hypothetical protein Patl1_29611 [Pistacia atlantica]|uniref:Uncharacterized protein n=1 Tax=Pistacia atlantica TaxID=434234 RepID=A0ACC1ACK1_9ROSI|nr:hypothetical protein Patl1_29611 [Pistacia atlantica]